MLNIRPQQICIFEEAGRAHQISKITEFLRERYSDAIAGLPEDNLRAKVTQGVEIARRFGLTWDSKVGAFVALMFDVSPHFYEHPAVRAVLEDPRIPGNYRLDRLHKRVTESDWREIETAWQQINE